MQRIYKLKGVVQPYAWGGSEFIPSLTGISAGAGQPAAEYWLGAHPSAPSVVDIEGQPTLLDLIRENKQEFLGENLPDGYDSLPFLVKILDVKDMLSIQVHPDQYQAKRGFEKENEAGVPLTDPNRNYKDPHRKTEVMFALSDFWLLSGFRPINGMKKVFAIPEFNGLEKYYASGGYEKLFKVLMRMEQAEVNEILKPLAERVTLLYNQGQLTKSNPDFWAAKALQTYFNHGNIDRGIFSIYLLNLTHLTRGQIVDQHPGILHAYLEGRNVEVMSNSDNVVRAGLTRKQVDAEELLKLVAYQQFVPVVTGPSFNTGYSGSEYEIGHFTSFPPSESFTIEDLGSTIILVTRGEVYLRIEEEEVVVKKGEAVFVLPGNDLVFSASSNVECFRVSVPKKEG